MIYASSGQLSDYSQIEDKRVVLENTVFGIRKLAEDVRKHCEFSFGRADIDFKVEIGPLGLDTDVEIQTGGVASVQIPIKKDRPSQASSAKSIQLVPKLKLKPNPRSGAFSQIRNPFDIEEMSASEDEAPTKPASERDRKLTESIYPESKASGPEPPKSESERHDVNAEGRGNDLVVISDEGKLRRLLICLLSNVGGYVTLISLCTGILTWCRPSNIPALGGSF